MKNLVLIILSLTFATVGKAQSVVYSDDGDYSVEIYVKPIEVVAPSSCQWGYNYKVNIQYDIIIKGSNPPANLYTLQGTLKCGSQELFYNLPNTGGSGIATTANNYSQMSNCNTATPASLGCDVLIIQISGPGISNRTFSTSPSSLPIELTYFKANLNTSNNVELSWETASELNNDFFTVERSVDAQNWEEVGKVDGVGNSSSTIDYSYLDYNPIGRLLYYRLKQTDFDGEYTYSSIEVVELPINSQLSLYPNPADNIITVSGINTELYSIVDIMGRNITSKTNVVSKSTNELIIDLVNLTRGSYLLISESSTIKFTKL